MENRDQSRYPSHTADGISSIKFPEPSVRLFGGNTGNRENRENRDQSSSHKTRGGRVTKDVI